MITMACWLVIYSQINGHGIRLYEQFTGTVVQEGTETNKLNFSKDFMKKGVDRILNNPIRWVKDNECLYVGNNVDIK